MKKPDEVKIISISGIYLPFSNPEHGVFGLGDDQRIYCWMTDTLDWHLYDLENSLDK